MFCSQVTRGTICSCNLPADQIFNILSQEPLQNCVTEAKVKCYRDSEEEVFFNLFFNLGGHFDSHLGAGGVGGDRVNAPRVPSTAVPGLHLVPLRVPLPQQDGLVQRRRQQQGGQAVCTQTGPGGSLKEGGKNNTAGGPPHLRRSVTAHLVSPRPRLSPRPCVRPPSSPLCPPGTRSWPFGRTSRLRSCRGKKTRPMRIEGRWGGWGWGGGCCTPLPFSVGVDGADPVVVHHALLGLRRGDPLHVLDVNHLFLERGGGGTREFH